MQANEFEKEIRNRMEGFEVVPTGEVWNQVSARIEKEKKSKRVLFFYVWAAILFLAGTTGWWFLNKNGEANKPITNTITVKDSLLPQTDITEIKKDTLVEKGTLAKKNALPSKVGANVAYGFTTPALKTQTGSWSKKVNRKTSVRLNDTGATDGLNNKQPVLNATNDKNDRIEKQLILLPHKFYKPGQAFVAAGDSINKGEELKDKKEIQSAVKPMANKKQPTGNWKLGVNMYGGISNNLAGIPVISNANYAADYLGSGTPQNSSGGGFSSPIAVLNYRKSFSYGVGAFVSRQLSKKFSLSTGIDYHFYSAKSSIGSKVNTRASFYDVTLQRTTSVSGFYSFGNTETFTNTYHYLELPVNLQLRINKNESKPVLFSIGITPGYLIGSKALYGNSREQKYYIENDQFRPLNFSTQSGLSFPVLRSNSYTINAGPVLQYGFTNMSKPQTRTNQHMFFTGIKTTITLK
jgi:hypothetical protein